MMTMSKKKTPKKPEPSNDPVEEATPKFLGLGERVRVARKSRVVDPHRAGEGVAPDVLDPIDQDVTGVEGEVCGPAYESPIKDGARCVPIKLANEAVIGVPEDRLERPRGESRSRAGYDRAYERGYDEAFRAGKNKKG